MMPRIGPGTSIIGLTLVMQSISVGILIYSFALFVVPWIEEFGASRRDVMLAVMCSQLATGGLSPFAGRAMDHFRLKYVVSLGAVILGLGLVLVSLSDGLWLVILLYATVLPLGMVLCGTLASQTLITRSFPRKRGMAMGISAMGTSMGGLLFPAVVQALISDFGWRSTMRILGAITVIVIVPLAWLVLGRDRPGTYSPSGIRANQVPRVGSLMRSRTFWIPVLAFIPLNAGFGAVQFNLGAYTQDLGYGPSSAAILISITSAAMICGKFVFGTLGDRVDHRYLYWVAASLLAVALLVYQNLPSYERMVGGAILLGLATGASMPLMGIIYASRYSVEGFGRVMGLAQSIFMLGAVGPLFAGWMFDLTGSYDPAFMALIVILLPVAAGMYWLPHQGRTRT